MKRARFRKVMTVLFATALISGAPAIMSSAQTYNVNASINEDSKESSTIEVVDVPFILSMAPETMASSSIPSGEVGHVDSNTQTSRNQAVSTSKSDSYFFAVPGNGWSTCNINISYLV